ncbi:hypothetical protein [Leucobacter tenebrionis]|uniref:hypothetical protein n=1 Tax=Leucobacter tenebrionis TaxID=2873270 RepID=UPI001CA72625|nr:hypothetical protein [Leucobacter tenebrionis]QZY52595.1 hypothetical protein KVY00_03815 [Leucobacter tenebrionis]
MSLATIAFAPVVTGCSAEAKRQDPRDPNTRSVILGKWTSDSTPGVRLSIEPNFFGIGGRCASAGSWTPKEGAFAARVETVPEIGGCPETMTLDMYEINGFRLTDDQKLIVTDSKGHEESFSEQE